MLIPHGHAVSPMNKMLDDMRGAGAGGARRAHSNRNGSTLSSGWHGTSPRESPRAAPGPKKASGTLDTLNSANEMEALQALFDLRSAGTVC